MDELIFAIAESIADLAAAVEVAARTVADSIGFLAEEPSQSNAIPMPPVGGWAVFDRKAA